MNLELCRSHNFYFQHAICFFVSLGTFSIRKIQSLLRWCWLNYRLPKINRFYMCISYIGLNLVSYSSPSFMCIASPCTCLTFLCTCQHKLANMSWWRWFFGQNTDQIFGNDTFLEKEIFELVARGNNEEKDKIWNFPLTSPTFYLNKNFFPVYFFHVCHFGSKIIISLRICFPRFKVI